MPLLYHIWLLRIFRHGGTSVQPEVNDRCVVYGGGKLDVTGIMLRARNELIVPEHNQAP